MKIKILTITIAILVVAMMGVVVADQTVLLCLGQGETVQLHLCNPGMEDYTCNSDICQLCAKRLDSGVYCSRSPNVCNSLGLSCSGTNASGELDTEAPIFSINSPVQDFIYNSKKVQFNLTSNEAATFYFKTFSEIRWRKLSTGFSYNKPVNLKEGRNEIMIKAVDNSGNAAEGNVSFNIDSKTPKIMKTLPKKGFADGSFFVEFKEDNPEELILHYGNIESSMQEKSIDFDSNGSCNTDRGKTKCDVNVDLSQYNEEGIEYYFTLEDIASSIVESKHLLLSVDTSDPVIVDLNYTIIGRLVNFNIEIDEDNFDSAEYYDAQDRNPRWKPLCSKLRDNVCVARKTFSEGDHDVSIQVMDEAGNSVAEAIQFIV